MLEDVATDDSCGDCLRKQDRKAMKGHLMHKREAKAKRIAHTKHIQAYARHEEDVRSKKPAKKSKPASESESLKRESSNEMLGFSERCFGIY